MNTPRGRIRIAGTGHRKCNKESATKWLDWFMKLHGDKEVVFITGGACGFDSVLARYCLDHKISYEIILPFPFDVHMCLWNQQDKLELQQLINGCAKLVILSNTYDSKVYLERNRIMVDSCDILVAYFDGVKKGGTWYTVKYAMKRNKVTHYVDL